MSMISAKEDIEEKLNSAIRRLLSIDKYLLEIDVHERSIAHKLAIYIQEEFKNWDVDFEYNRIMRLNSENTTAKTINSETEKLWKKDSIGKSVYPDIIVHRRDTDENLLAIELKKTTNSKNDDHDCEKLKAYREQLGYQYAVFIKLRTGKEGIGLVECKFITTVQLEILNI